MVSIHSCTEGTSLYYWGEIMGLDFIWLGMVFFKK